MSASRSHAVVCAAIACALAGLAAPLPALSAQGAVDTTAVSVHAPAVTPSVQPAIRGALDGPLLAAGAALLLVGLGMDATVQPVPAEGLDPDGIRWSLDRASLGRPDARADTQSDYVLGAAFAYPLVVAFATGPPGDRRSGTLRRSVLYAEAILLSQGLTSLLKNSFDRPRPFTYLPAEQRWGEPDYDVTAEGAFQSMPSGHSAVAFCAAAFAMTDHLISRPRAGWLERAGVSFGGGLLAGVAAAMRVEAGVHFPSDVITGGLVGTSTGMAVPLVHHYPGAESRRAPRPPGRAWAQAIAGMLAGACTGVLLADAIY